MAAPRRSGFTLIEILAVVVILALLATLIAPNFRMLRVWKVRGEAERLAARLELARQRAIVTGVPHRLWLDLNDAEFRVEWYQSEEGQEDAQGTEARPAPADFDLTGNSPLPLAAPRGPERGFRPIPGQFGNLEVIADPFYIARLETPQGTIHDGEAWVTFDREGGAEYTEIYLEDKEGLGMALDVYPLDDRVRIRDDT